MSDKVAYIIVCWNNQDLLEECLDSIKQQAYKDSVTILIDNGSEDESVKTAKRLMPEARVIEAKANLGFAKGNNLGIEEALKDIEVKYIVLLNTDARLLSTWTETLVSFAKNKPKAACLQSITLDYYNHSIIDSTHIFVSRNSQATQGSWRKPYIDQEGPKKVFGVNAAACLITRDFIEAQPFGRELLDERMFMYLEDVDLAARATVMGWDNYLVPNTQAYHMGSASSGKNPNFSLYMTFRNNLAMLIKNMPFRILLKLIIAIPRSDYHTIKHLRLRGKKEAARKVIKGRLIGLMMSPLFIYKRIKLSRSRVINSDFLWSLMKKGF